MSLVRSQKPDYEFIECAISGGKTQQEKAELDGVSQKCASLIKKKHESSGQGRVVFSDESNFEVINRKSKVIVKRLNNEKYNQKFCVPSLKNGRGSAGKWRCISSKDTGVCNMYTGRINQYVYRDTPQIIHLLPSVELFYDPEDHWIFQQEDASAHTAYSIRDWYKEQNIEVLSWCPRSLDLNPIEN
ncbi:unnamed protein product [Brachionus calyciflorus]|uniref:Tc1-like transposase DDE domain-containing protein n=1 Tax=Brachionus calyciflorus TaxID=104777 RepID=A0A813W9Z0_9BILA|nr:unnamed protein product [Brachionus calyciflorus]